MKSRSKGRRRKGNCLGCFALCGLWPRLRKVGAGLQSLDDQCNEGQSENEAYQRAKQKRRPRRLDDERGPFGFQWRILTGKYSDVFTCVLFRPTLQHVSRLPLLVNGTKKHVPYFGQ